MGFNNRFLPFAMVKIQVQNLHKSFGSKTVFSGVNFTHHDGSLGIAGSNGSGKTTLLKCLAGLLNPTDGQIQRFEGDAKLPLELFKKKLGYIAPYINLYSELSCRENLEFLAKLHHLSIKNGTVSIEKWLKVVKLDHLGDQPFGKLSTGQQQRLRLASGLFYEPQILMLDEPGSNLDEDGHSLIREIVKDFLASGKTIILASNNKRELALCDHIYSIENERIVAD